MSEFSAKDYWPPSLFYALAAAVAAWTLHLCYGFYTDDAYISLNYSRNLLNGNGLIWQPGNHTEGYTNFLFIILCAGLGKLGIDLVLASRIIATAGFIGSLLVVAYYLRRAPRNPADNACRALGLSLIISSVPMIVWCMGGLEGNLAGFFLTGGVCLALRVLQEQSDRRSAALMGFSFALAMMTRPDMSFFFVLTMAFLGAVWLRYKSPPFKHLFIAGLVFTAIFIPYTAWRIWYFGDILPNTYYAKTYGIDPAILWYRGWTYVLGCSLGAPLLAPMALVITALLALKRQVNLPVAYLCFLCLAFLTYICSVGGDFMPDRRFLLPIFPAMALWVYHGSATLIAYRRTTAFRLISTLFLIFIAENINLAKNDRRDIYVGSLSSLAVKDYIASHWPQGSTIAINPAGTLPYFEPQYHYVDMLGLQTPAIAHRVMKPEDYQTIGQGTIGHIKGDGAYVLSRKPDYIIFGHGWGTPTPMFLSEAEMLKLPQFARDYQKVEVYVTPEASLLPQLKRANEINIKVQEAIGRYIVFGLVMNDRDQLRFVYYQRRH